MQTALTYMLGGFPFGVLTGLARVLVYGTPAIIAYSQTH